MSARTKILGKVREALQVLPPHPISAPPGAVFPAVAGEDLLQRFEREAECLNMDFYQAMDWGDAGAWLKAQILDSRWSEMVVTPDSDSVELGRRIGARVLVGERDCGPMLKSVDLAITSCECIIARTGSIVLTSHQGFGRVVSILPPNHLVVVRRGQIVFDLGEAIRYLQTRHGRFWPSMMSIVTGPSRTADIEKTLVLGAHGPKRLLVLVLDF
jgi:L-lactate dehydrogenase complex protein LldG